MAKKQSGWRSEVSRETARLRDEGRELREAVPRETHAGWAPRGDRRDPVEILEQQAATRIAELVPVRYGRMAVSPFAFFRGAAAIMAADLARTPSTSLRVQSCGDAHLVNFGAFAAPDRRRSSPTSVSSTPGTRVLTSTP